jgi:hypothetical protein
MTWLEPDSDTSTQIMIETRQSPVWILGVAFLLTLIGLTASIFLGTAGSVGGYVLGLLAFSAILLFRRRHGVLSQTAFVDTPSGLSALLVAVFGFTVVEIVLAVWPIATEVSRR